MNNRLDYIILSIGSMSMPTAQNMFEWIIKILMFLVALRQIIKGIRKEGSIKDYIRFFFKKK